MSPRCGADLSAMGAFDIPSINMSLLVPGRLLLSFSHCAVVVANLLIASKLSSVTSASGGGIGMMINLLGISRVSPKSFHMQEPCQEVIILQT